MNVYEKLVLDILLGQGEISLKGVPKRFNHELDGVGPLIADPPSLKLHQEAKSTPSVKWP